ncbi:MAG: DUF2314 domain-containing protein [Aquabacterium sp.]|jgi:uncharacterized protein YegJ (DUF2314 family)|uniref:DUF2314 domain-containing protein n=1 Tax=Aquabacterium sp. TaxID=1872578 RepID=UPI001B795F06|nr:DUF2314 domain-containing protein [Aquabacterium sp.]MBP7131488.1 DUF2314 domain-containing protein [Aquabacterium sp.]
MRHLSLTLLVSALLCSAAPAWAQARAASAPVAAASAASAASSASGKPAQQVMDIDPTAPHIKAAMKRARASAKEVLKVAASGNPKYENVGVRVLVSEGKQQEFIWLMPIEKTDKGYVGIVNSAPVVLKRLQFRMHHNFKPQDIVDWMYTDKVNKTMHGQFITCAQVMKEAPQDAPVLKRRYGLNCAR